MAFVGDREDVVSIALTGMSNFGSRQLRFLFFVNSRLAVQNFFEKFNISPKDIGRLEVGTETIIDKSKSVKTYLMELFGDNTNVEVYLLSPRNTCLLYQLFFVRLFFDEFIFKRVLIH